MNDATLYPGMNVPTTQRHGTRRTWLVSLTVICFLFGGLLAAQLRAMQQVRENQVKEKEGLVEAKERMGQLQVDVAQATKARKDLEVRLKRLQAASANGLSAAQAKQLNSQIKELQQIAGLTPVSGPGVVIVLKDNPAAADAGDPSPFLPGIVHDFDLLQVVNELRAAQADAIAINGRRITGYTPIRCVGPVIYINGEGEPPPFRIEAIGNADKLMTALKMPNGIVSNLEKQTLGVRITSSDNLHLPPGEGVPRFRVARSR